MAPVGELGGPDAGGEPVARQWAHRWRATAVAASVYLALAVGLWWHVWTAAPRTTTVCGCGDASFTLWFVEFAAHALRTGSSPFVTTLLWHPHGVNVLDDASQLGLGLPLAPLCREDCAGLCGTCGADRHDAEPCGCQPETDPRWATLDALRVPDQA